MSTKLKGSPKNATIEELQAGIQKNEDAGYELISVTKGTVAGEEMNVLTFSERSEELVGTVELLPSKAGATEDDINEAFEKIIDAGIKLRGRKGNTPDSQGRFLYG